MVTTKAARQFLPTQGVIMSRRILAAGLLLLLGCTAEQGPTEAPDNPSFALKGTSNYTTVDLGTLGGSPAFAYALAINSRGQVVGASRAPSGAIHAFLWDRGVMTDLGTLGGDFSQGLEINERGQVVGVGQTTAGTYHAFLWEDGVMSDLGTIDDRRSSALGINARGQIVGGADGIPVIWDKQAIVSLPLPAGGTFCEVQEINAADRSVGQCTINGTARAVLWDRDGAVDLGDLGTSPATATGINASGAVVGISGVLSGGGGSRPFLWEQGTMTDLSTQSAPPGFIPNAINAGGQIAGSWGGGDFIHAGVWQRGATIDISVPGIDNYLVDISASGQAVGYTVSTNDYHAVLWTRR